MTIERTGGRERRGGAIALGGLALAVAAVVVVAVIYATAGGSLSTGATALARVGLPSGGGMIQSVTATGPRGRAIPVTISGNEIFPRHRIPAGEQVNVSATVTRPGWISWLSGKTEHLQMTLTTPAASLQDHFLTLKTGAPLRLTFTDPVSTISYGAPGRLERHVLASPQSVVTVPRPAAAGTITVAATPRSWENANGAVVSYFPAGTGAAAVASPAPGAQLLPHSKLTLTFSTPVNDALGGKLPALTPAGSGSWKQLSSHTIQFRPQGYGYGLGATVRIALPSGVKLVGAPSHPNWSVPAGSTTRLQQLLAQLGYLPYRFSAAGSSANAGTPSEQENLAINPPAGSFRSDYPNLPGQVRSMWAPGTFGTMTKGALMAFENDRGLTADGTPGPLVWKTLINAADHNRGTSLGYTFVTVSKGSQSVNVWHSGKTVVTSPANTGIAGATTASGVFPVFEHLSVTTMSGTNPDGSQYNDPGIQYVSYFNGGDALHAFNRASFGSPQSLGCVELPLAAAAKIYPFTPIGTLVSVS